MPPSSSLTGLHKAAFDPLKGMGDVSIDNGMGVTSQIDPSTDPGAYGYAIQDAATHKNFGTPGFLGGPGGVNAANYQALDEALQALSKTTGKNYGFAKPKTLGEPLPGMGGTGIQ